MKTLNKKGFTLLEVILVVYIFSMGILGLSTLVIKNIQLEIPLSAAIDNEIIFISIDYRSSLDGNLGSKSASI